MTEFESVKHSFRLGAVTYIVLAMTGFARVFLDPDVGIWLSIIFLVFLFGMYLVLKKTNPLYRLGFTQRKAVIKKYKLRRWILISFSALFFISAGLFYYATSLVEDSLWFGAAVLLLSAGVFTLLYTLRMTPLNGAEVFN